MTDEPDKIVKTKTRRFPEDIDDEDIELIMKEWRLAGYEVYCEARTVVGFDPDVGPERGRFLYQRYKDKWIWLDLPAADKAFTAMGMRLQKQAQQLERAQTRDRIVSGGGSGATGDVWGQQVTAVQLPRDMPKNPKRG